MKGIDFLSYFVHQTIFLISMKARLVVCFSEFFLLHSVLWTKKQFLRIDFHAGLCISRQVCVRTSAWKRIIDPLHPNDVCIKTWEVVGDMWLKRSQQKEMTQHESRWCWRIIKGASSSVFMNSKQSSMRAASGLRRNS